MSRRSLETDPLVGSGYAKEGESDCTFWLHHVCGALFWVVVITYMTVYGIVDWKQKGRLDALEVHTHPQCYGAATKTAIEPLNISQNPVLFSDWTEIQTECMGFENGTLVTTKAGFYEIHGRVVIGINASLSEPTVIALFGEVFRLYAVANGLVVGNYGEGMYVFADSSEGNMTYAFRASTGVHHHIYMGEGTKLSLGLSAANTYLWSSNFSSIKEFQDYVANFTQYGEYLLLNADLSATYKGVF